VEAEVAIPIFKQRFRIDSAADDLTSGVDPPKLCT
jgi:hypothetical protein